MGNARSLARERRGNVVLVIVKNDPEACVTVRLAKLAGIATIQLEASRMGISLDDQPEAFDAILAARKREVWLFELPGPQMEAALRASYKVTVIDHHAYHNLGLDRTCDDEGNLRPSALEQFLELAGIDDQELRMWDFNPRTIRGIGYFDAKLARGLRENDYDKREIGDVMALREEILRDTTPNFDEVNRKAALAWGRRERRNDRYWFVTAGGGVANAMLRYAIEDELDEDVIVTAAHDGQVFTVRHVSPEVIAHLTANIDGHTFVFGSNNCFGIDNRHGDARQVKLKHVLAALETAPW